jgi:hypothetical protein
MNEQHSVPRALPGLLEYCEQQLRDGHDLSLTHAEATAVFDVVRAARTGRPLQDAISKLEAMQ